MATIIANITTKAAMVPPIIGQVTTKDVDASCSAVIGVGTGSGAGAVACS